VQPTRTIVCPECGLEESLTLPLYVRADDASVRKELIEGRLGTHPCSGCGFAGFAAFPLLWDDAENDLLTMLVKDDSETLLDDFEELLRRCRGEMGETAFQLALERNYQIVTSVTALCEMVTAAEVGRYCYRSSPGLTEADDFDRTSLVIAAKTLRQAGHLEDASTWCGASTDSPPLTWRFIVSSAPTRSRSARTRWRSRPCWRQSA